MTFQSDCGPLRRVLLKHARDAFVSRQRITEQWATLGYVAAPAWEAACRESDALAKLLEELGIVVEWMPAEDVGMDSIYVRDAALMTDAGAILCRMGKRAREQEPEALARSFSAIDISILESIAGTGTLEGGDVTWLDRRTVAVGRGYRSNREGITQLRTLLGSEIDLIEVALPHWRGPGDVFHLMSMISPLAEDLLLVYSPLLPVPFRESLLSRGFGLVEVPQEEFATMGCNVLAVAPRVAVALAGNPETARRLETAGVEVHLYEGAEISAKGCGGPTCLTRPLERG
jgi:N-dimethylarginine dimethylaminohydrolase